LGVFFGASARLTAVSGRRTLPIIYMAYVVALSNAALPAAAGYFPCSFFGLRAKKRTTKEDKVPL
jgi:hypothetical protein